MKKECFVFVVLSILSTSLAHFPLHLETLKENWLQESSVMAGRDAVKRLVDFGQISDVRVFLFHSNVVFIQISKHIYKATLQEGKGMQRVSTILSEAVGIAEILCLAKECFISSVHWSRIW